MLTIEEGTELLRDFGLTSNQARVYFAVLQLGVARVGAIARVSKIRREDIYRTLPKLEKMGLVERVLGTPTRTKALPVDDALAVLVKRQQEDADRKLAEIIEKKNEFLAKFKTSGRIGNEDLDTQFSLISDKNAILAKMAVSIRNAQNEIDIISSRSKITQLLFLYSDFIKKAVKKGAKIRIITELPEIEGNILRILEEQISPGKSFSLRYLERVSSHHMTVDNKEALMATITESLLTECPSLWTNSLPLVELLQRNFEELWITSRSPDQRLISSQKLEAKVVKAGA